ncbi:hypothetical protein C8Q80DRAFT_1342533 [Daedaleopsis nitida]|nr:hypothetical protein C8Q80DRAFT_1342533 [Daedaleopsis nitida]
MSTIWPNILLLLCLFHTWQAWKNGLNRSLAGIPISEARTSVRKRLAAFCMQLLKHIIDYSEATAAFRVEQDYFQTLQHPGRTTLEKKLGSGGLKFLQYLSSYLASRDLWLQWSHAGVIQAAETLGIPEKSVPRTTNHLESHNGHIKNDYFAQHQHGGQLPRADVWIIALVTEVIPDFFFRRHNTLCLQEHRAWLRSAPSTRQATVPSDPSARITSPVKPPPHLAVSDDDLIDSMCAEPSSSGSGPHSDSDSSHEALESLDSWMDQPEIALDSSQILADISSEFPGLDSLSEIALAPPDTPPFAPNTRTGPLLPGSAPGSRNQRAVLLQELLQVSDICADLIRRLRDLGTDPDVLTPYVSPYNTSILTGDSNAQSSSISDTPSCDSKDSSWDGRGKRFGKLAMHNVELLM